MVLQLKNETFGFTPDRCFFDDEESAVEYLIGLANLEDHDENERLLSLAFEYCHAEEITERYSLIEVYDTPVPHYGCWQEVFICRNHLTSCVIDGSNGEIICAVVYEE